MNKWRKYENKKFSRSGRGIGWANVEVCQVLVCPTTLGAQLFLKNKIK